MVNEKLFKLLIISFFLSGFSIAMGSEERQNIQPAPVNQSGVGDRSKDAKKMTPKEIESEIDSDGEDTKVLRQALAQQVQGIIARTAHCSGIPNTNKGTGSSTAPTKSENIIKGDNKEPLSPLLWLKILNHIPEKIKQNIMEIAVSLGKREQVFAVFQGMPGVAKSTVAQALAERARLPHMFIHGTTLYNKWVNTASKSLEATIGEMINEHGSSHLVIVIDEIDQLRSYEGLADNPSFALGRIKDIYHQVSIIGTTNYLADWARTDPACVSRFDYQIEFDLPTYEQRLDVIEEFCRKQSTEPAPMNLSEQEMRTLAQASNGLTQRAICQSMKKANKAHEAEIEAYNLGRELEQLIAQADGHAIELENNAPEFRPATAQEIVRQFAIKRSEHKSAAVIAVKKALVSGGKTAAQGACYSVGGAVGLGMARASVFAAEKLTTASIESSIRCIVYVFAREPKTWWQWLTFAANPSRFERLIAALRFWKK